MMRLNLPLTGPEELAAVGKVLESGYLTQGPKVAEFESLVAKRAGTRYGFATSSATTGLHLALRALGIKTGDEVIIPDFTFPATANAVIQQGAVPVFVDIDINTFNIDPDQLEEAITDRTRAIMPVHAFGLPADMDPIRTVAQKHGLWVVEDAACALGSEYHGRPAGSLGDAGVFSFHPRKIITTGEGGLLSTSNEEMAKRVSVLRTHGAIRDTHFMTFVDAGYNYRLSDVLGAIGLAQMERLDYILKRRSHLADRYNAEFSNAASIRTPVTPSGLTHSFQSYVVLLDENIDRNAVIDGMRDAGVETTLGTYSMHLQPYFAERFGIEDAALPQATRAHKSALTLPLYPQLTDAEVAAISETLKSVLTNLA